MESDINYSEHVTQRSKILQQGRGANFRKSEGQTSVGRAA